MDGSLRRFLGSPRSIAQRPRCCGADRQSHWQGDRFADFRTDRRRNCVSNQSWRVECGVRPGGDRRERSGPCLDVAPGVYNLRATQAGYRSEWFNDVKCQIVCIDPPPPPQWTLSAGSTFTADHALDPLASISGTVRDSVTLAPLSGPSDASYLVGLFEGGGRLLANDVTDSSGQYTLTGLLPGTYFVGMRSAPGYVPELHNNIACIAEDCPPTVGTPIVLGVGTEPQSTSISIEAVSSAAQCAAPRMRQEFRDSRFTFTRQPRLWSRVL